jgi:phytanoyl-CoA hydroxylase
VAEKHKTLGTAARKTSNGTPRTSPPTQEEIAEYNDRGFVIPGKLLAEETVERLREAVQEHFEGKFERTVTYDFADPALDTKQGLRMAKRLSPREEAERRAKAEKSLPILINLWEIDGRFQEVTMSAVAAGWAGQLLGADEVLLFEDTAFVKAAGKGGALHWHQDYSYFPLATPDVVTFWIALDDVNADNGTIKYAVGTHKLGEVLPVNFTLGVKDGTEFAAGASYMHAEREGVPEIGDPVAMGMEIVELVLKKGECVIHHALTWHASGPNESDRPRRALGVRYVKASTIWLGEQRFPYRPDSKMDFSVPGPIVPGRQFPRVERAF